MVPHLITALSGPLNELEQRVLDSMPAIERWFRLEWMERTPPFYCAADLRNAGFKLAPVSTDLFPQGWHHLSDDVLPLAVQAAMAAIEKICPEARNLLVIPENQSSGAQYLDNVVQLRRIFSMAGLNVRIGSIDARVHQTTTAALPGGEVVALEPVIRSKRRLGVKDFDPCTILLNNSLAAGVPGIVEELHEQYLLPPLHASASVRRESRHFQSYEEVAKRFGKMLGIDHWLIHPLFGACQGADLADKNGQQDLAEQVDTLLTKVRRKYKEYGIKEKPFAVIKSDRAARGARVAAVRDAREIATLAGMYATLPGGAGAQDFLVQEGVPTHERMHEAMAEPVVYMMDRYVVGGFYRMHPQRDSTESLSAPGAGYVPLAFAHGTQLPQVGARAGASAPNRFYMYGVVARVAMVAASYELEATDPNAEVYD